MVGDFLGEVYRLFSHRSGGPVPFVDEILPAAVQFLPFKSQRILEGAVHIPGILHLVQQLPHFLLTINLGNEMHDRLTAFIHAHETIVIELFQAGEAAVDH